MKLGPQFLAYCCLGLLLLVLACPSSATGAGPAQTGASHVTPDRPAGTLPSAPLGVVALPKDHAVALRWSPPASNGSAKLVGYLIVFSPIQNSSGRISIGVTNHTWIPGLINGVLYSFQVAARNLVGVGPFSAVAQTIPAGLPASPSDLTAVPHNASASLSWRAPISPPGYPILGYFVNVTQGHRSVQVEVSAPPAVVTGLIDGLRARATVRAFTAIGRGPESRGISFVPLGTPDAPRHVAATYNPTAEAIQLTWVPAGWTGGAPVDNFTVQWTASNGASGTARTGPNATGWTLTRVSPGITYTFQIQASSIGGSGPTTTTVLSVGPAASAAVLASPLAVLAEFLGTVALICLVLRAGTRTSRRPLGGSGPPRGADLRGEWVGGTAREFPPVQQSRGRPPSYRSLPHGRGPPYPPEGPST